MAGYTRTDTTNNIADGNVINAVDFDNEYNAIEAAFNASTGHTHDGTSAEGAPITKVGPAQDVTVSINAVLPKTDNAVDLGSGSLEFKDLYIDGTANIDSLVADTADINGGTIDGATIATSDITVGSGKTLNVSAGTLTLADNQISGDKVEGGTINAITINTLTSGTVDINGGAIDGTAIGAASASTGAFTSLTSSSTTTLNGTTIPSSVTLVSTAATQTLTNKTLTSPVIGTIVNTGTLTLPTSTDTLVGRATTDTLTNKTINLTSNTLVATSAQIAAAVTDETGTGALVFANSPTLVTPALGTPASGVVTNLTGTASININGTVGATTASTGAFTTLAYTGTLTGGTGVINIGSGQLYKDASGNVGIGTSSPVAALNVIASPDSITNAQVMIGNGSSATAQKLTFNPTLSSAIAGLSDGSMVFFGNGANTERMRITSAGNVGIGTSSPSQKLHISNDGINIKLDRVSAGGLIYHSDSTTGADFRFQSQAGNVALFCESGSNGVIKLVTEGSERMRIDSAGNVGIGTSSPVSPLTVNKGNVTGAGQWASSAIAVANPTNTGSYSQIAFGYTVGTTNAAAYMGFISTSQASNGFGDLVFGTRSVSTDTQPSERMRIDSAGNVGIGTSSPDAKLQVAGGANPYVVQNSGRAVYGIDIQATAGAAGAFGGALSFGAGEQGRAAIAAVQGTSDSDTVGLAFFAHGSATGSADAGEAMRIDSIGNLLVGTTVSSSQTGTTIRPDGVIVSKGVYNTLVSASTRAIHMDSSGFFGYISSTRDSKTNINDLSNVNWLYQLNPVSFNYKKVDRETNTRLEEAEEETQYGLIAEDTAQVNDTLCFYDTTENGQELKGIAYEKLVVPMLKAIQEQQAIINDLKARLDAANL
jgi:hypothetical protein